jgi:uncharacterized protein (TIGR00725 family)
MPVILDLPKKEDVAVDNKPKLTLTLDDNRLFKNVTFFGDSAIPEGDPIYESVSKAARILAENGYVIIDGGGPGIMKAATDGAESVNGKTIGVYWEPKLASHFEGKNITNITDESATYSNYMMRTLGLIEKGDVYVVCKGGTGTISEFGMVWCLAKIYYGCHKPVILYGDFWDDLIVAIQKAMYIDEVELGVLHKAKTPEEVLELIQSFETVFAHCKVKPTTGGDESAFVITSREASTMQTYNKVASSYHASHIGKLVAQVQLDEFMGMVNSPARVLDLGCGPGYDMKYLAQKYSVTGLEPVKKFVNIAQLENPGSEIICDDVTKVDLGINKFKGIWARDSIHHIKKEDQDLVFKKVYDALVEGGIYYVIVREGEGEIMEKHKQSNELEMFYHLFSREELTERATRAGFKVIKIDEQQRSHKWLSGVFQK